MKNRLPVALGATAIALLTTGVLAGLLAVGHHIAKYSLNPPEMFGFYGLFIIVALMAGFVSLISCICAGIAVLMTRTTIRTALALGLIVGLLNACVLELFTIIYHEQYLAGIITLSTTGAVLAIGFGVINRKNAQQGVAPYVAQSAPSGER